ncbi:MAG: mannose-1-phosphate guanylyltransferase [Bacteriovoracaceae bacterium]|jgi:mannose-1-phosphate guanylyltransferase|nr:mannose-1-phosphate guanylyltransferase [Bacteriovoracaceae bacterium]
MKTIVLCGGSGKRLWPLSHKRKPKQFLSLFNNKSLFEMTINRNSSISEEFIIVTNKSQYNLCKEQLKFEKVRFILEDIGRNTASAITLACLAIEDKSQIVLVTPSDHIIKDQKAYIDAVKLAKKFALDGYLATFGICPTYPETGYGYIERNNSHVKSFKEKPSIEEAKTYFKDSSYLWNSGIFCFKIDTFLNELKKYSPKIYDNCLKVFNKNNSENNNYRFSKQDLIDIEATSIDYAVMEKSKKIKVIDCKFEWNDLGSFDSLSNILNSSDEDNIINIESKNNFIINDKKPVALIGVEDLIVIDTEEGILICKKGYSQKIKEVTKRL